MFQEIIRESPGFKYLTEDLVQEKSREAREEAREEALQAAATTFAQVFRAQAAKRFPLIELGAELERIHDPALWGQLFNDLEQIPDADALRRRVAELSRQTNGTASATHADPTTNSETQQ